MNIQLFCNDVTCRSVDKDTVSVMLTGVDESTLLQYIEKPILEAEIERLLNKTNKLYALESTWFDNYMANWIYYKDEHGKRINIALALGKNKIEADTNAHKLLVLLENQQP